MHNSCRMCTNCNPHMSNILTCSLAVKLVVRASNNLNRILPGYLQVSSIVPAATMRTVHWTDPCMHTCGGGKSSALRNHLGYFDHIFRLSQLHKCDQRMLQIVFLIESSLSFSLVTLASFFYFRRPIIGYIPGIAVPKPCN